MNCIVKTDGNMIDQLIVFDEPPRYIREFLEDDIWESLLVTYKIN